MKNFYILSFVLLFLASCGSQRHKVVIENPLSFERVGELVEINVADADKLRVLDASGKELPSQVTHTGSLIFQVTIAANGRNEYQLVEGVKADIDTLAIGRIYPERFKDIAWESDKIGFRMYDKEAGTKVNLYGYDIFTKRGKYPMLDMVYGVHCDVDYEAKIKEFRKVKSPHAQTLTTAKSYHIDHGYGMDYYVVGPTMGCGVSALCTKEGVHYPTYYTSYEVLDGGGLRFSFKVGFDPVKIDGDMVVEERIITLDAGSHLNHVEVTYKNLTNPTKVITGLVLRDNGEVSAQGDNYVAYAEPVHAYGWQTYDAIIFDKEKMDPKMDLFDEARMKAHGGAFGHLQAEGTYTPNEPLKYYTGAGWNRGGFKTPKDWFDYIAKIAETKENPLVITVK